MNKVLFLASVMLSLSVLWAADKIQPPDVKLGLWETTMTHAPIPGLGMSSIPPDTLAKMTPEQRARMEEMLKNRAAGSKTTTTKSCITREKLEKNVAFHDERSDCAHTVLSSSSSGFEVKFHCAETDSSSDGTVKLEVINSENAKGAVHMVLSRKGQTMNIDNTFTSRYLGSACGDVK